MITKSDVDEYGLSLELPSFYSLEHDKLSHNLEEWSFSNLEEGSFSDRIAQAIETKLIDGEPTVLRQPSAEHITRATQLLKQGRTFIQLGTEAQDETKPILLYYGLSQTWGFFVASFLDHGDLPRTHGLSVISSTAGFRVKMHRSGAFTRLVDLLAILGIRSQYSSVLLDDTGKISESSSERKYPFDIPLETLHGYFAEHWKMTTSSHQGVLLDQDSYMLTFVASFFARYRPEVWKRIVEGLDGDTSMISFRGAFKRVPLMYRKAVATFMGTVRHSAPENTLLAYDDDESHGFNFTLDSRL